MAMFQNEFCLRKYVLYNASIVPLRFSIHPEEQLSHAVNLLSKCFHYVCFYYFCLQGGCGPLPHPISGKCVSRSFPTENTVKFARKQLFQFDQYKGELVCCCLGSAAIVKKLMLWHFDEKLSNSTFV